MTSFFMAAPETALGAQRWTTSKRPELLPASLGEISQRINMTADPILSHLRHRHVRREIRVDDDPDQSIGGVYDFWRG